MALKCPHCGDVFPDANAMIPVCNECGHTTRRPHATPIRVNGHMILLCPSCNNERDKKENA